jgi:hypothetical protein
VGEVARDARGRGYRGEEVVLGGRIAIGASLAVVSYSLRFQFPLPPIPSPCVGTCHWHTG